MVFPPAMDTSPKYSPSLALSKNRQERRAFQYFQEEVCHQLPGLLEERFWSKCVLQTAIHDSTIQHAIYAFSSFHENFSIGSDFNPNICDFALKQYEIAIRKARISAQQPMSLFVCLVTSMIFMLIESIQGHSAFAIQLSKHSRVVFNQLVLHKKENRKTDKDLANMETFIQRTEIHADNFVGEVRSDFHVHSKDDIQAPPPPPDRFSSIHEAKVYYENLLYQFSQVIFNPIDPPGAIIHQRLQEWDLAVEDLEKRLDLDKSGQRQTLALLKMHKLKHQLICELPRPFGRLDHDDAIWDTQYDNFQKLVSLAEEATIHNRPSRPILTFNHATILTMMLTAMRCRDPIIRRRAIAVMRASNQVEFVWDSQKIAAVTECFMEIEEAGLGIIRSADDVPMSARLCRVKRIFDAGSNTCAVEYISRWRPFPLRYTVLPEDGRLVLSSTDEHSNEKALTVGLWKPANTTAS